MVEIIFKKNMFARVGIVCLVISFCFSSVYAVIRPANSICVERTNDVLVITGEGNGRYLSERMNISAIVNNLHQGSQRQNSFCFMLNDFKGSSQQQSSPYTAESVVTDRPNRDRSPAYSQNTEPNNDDYRNSPNYDDQYGHNPYTAGPVVTQRPNRDRTSAHSQNRRQFEPNSDDYRNSPNYDDRYGHNPYTAGPVVTQRPNRDRTSAHSQNRGQSEPNSDDYRNSPNYDDQYGHNPYTAGPVVTDRPNRDRSPAYSQNTEPNNDDYRNSPNYDDQYGHNPYTAGPVVTDRPNRDRSPAYSQNTKPNSVNQRFSPNHHSPQPGANLPPKNASQNSTPIPDILNLDPSLSAYFVDNYQPISNPLQNIIQIESNSTLSRSEFKRLVKGITNSNLFVSPQASVDPHQYLFPTGTLCSFARLVCSKKEVQIDPSKLKPLPALVGNIRSIVRNKNSTSLQRAKKLVQTLNKYSWYVPVRYILGGAFYETECTPLNGYTDFEESKNTLKAHLKASYVDYIQSDDRQNSVQNLNTPAPNNMDIWSVGANGAKDIVSFFKNIETEQNWQIIRYVDFYPTLLLLEKDYNWEFSECAKLLRDYYFKNEITQLQYQIDIYKYAQTMIAALSPKPF